MLTFLFRDREFVWKTIMKQNNEEVHVFLLDTAVNFQHHYFNLSKNFFNFLDCIKTPYCEDGQDTVVSLIQCDSMESTTKIPKLKDSDNYGIWQIHMHSLSSLERLR